MDRKKMQSSLKNSKSQKDMKSGEYYSQSDPVNSASDWAYYYNTAVEPTKESLDFARGFALGYFKGCNSSVQLTYKQGDVAMTSAEIFESFKQIITKLDNLAKDEKNDFSELSKSINALDKKVDKLLEKKDSIFKSKQLWIPVICSIFVAVLTAFLTALFEGKI